ncbi:transposable element Tcb2 transposase [Trichonephila clavipes]|uniref:Transposable element Tcb2 transposase n=1 Tax=Trichonephila clavipes TaxID=2585209 RepID=A0A8X6R9T1_TRICX|nr:transposable element Tcb2 transposase [Trichonephila clavipes]
MSSRHHIDDFMRGRIIGKIEEGRKITDVAREFDIAHSVVSRLWKSFKTTGMCSRRHGGGRVRSTTPAEDRYIVLSAERNRRTTAQQVANQFLAASGKQISRKTVARRWRGGGLYARRPVVCVPLTRQHRTTRLQWCREHHNWSEQDWACVLFTDEKNIKEKDRYPTCSIMVWAGIMINGRTRLHVVANGTMTGQRYIDEGLLPHVRLSVVLLRVKFEQISVFERGRIVGLREAGLSYRAVAARVQRNSSTIMRVSKQWTDEGRTARKSGSGPRNVTSTREDRRLVRMAQTDRTAFSRQLAAQWSTATRVSLCASSIRRRLLQRGLRARIPLYRISLTQNHRRLRLHWANVHRSWRADWQQVVFSDKSRFNL